MNSDQRVRTSRRAKTKEIVQQKFGFNIKEELLKYKYFKGIKLKKKDWRRLESISFVKIPNSHVEWEAGIGKKYESYSQLDLKEFSHYLDYMIYSGTTTNELNAIISSAITSSLLSAMFTQIVGEQISSDFLKTVIIMMLWIVLGVAFMVWFAVFAVTYLMWDRKITNKFLQDYKKVIDSLIEKNANK